VRSAAPPRGSAPRHASAARDAFAARVRMLSRRARWDRITRRAVQGLCYGLLPGAAAALAAGSVPLPLPAAALAGAAGIAGALVGAGTALVRRTDVRRLLAAADRALGARELASTAGELCARPPQGRFSEPVIEDAAALLGGATARQILGRQRLTHLPYAAALVGVILLSLAFPFDLRGLFAARESASMRDLASIGEELQSYGQRLQGPARSQGRSLALPQELAQLGKELADRTIQKDEALDRIQELSRRLSQEYELRRIEGAQAGAPGSGRSGASPGATGTPGTSSAGPEAGAGRQASDQELKDLEEAVDKLREAEQKARDAQDEALSTAEQGRQTQPGAERPREQGSGPGLPPGDAPSADASAPDAAAPDAAQRGAGQASGEAGSAGGGAAPDGASGAGTAPSASPTGPATDIARGGPGQPQRTEADPAEGEATRLLVRALPEWTGSKLSEDRTVRQYASGVESALARDEVPPKLRESVKGYFTIIGVSAGEPRR
jgi:hypothetical protein